VGSIVSAALGASAAGVVKESRTVSKIVSLKKGHFTHVPDSVETCIYGSKCKSLDERELPLPGSRQISAKRDGVGGKRKMYDKSPKVFEKW